MAQLPDESEIMRIRDEQADLDAKLRSELREIREEILERVTKLCREFAIKANKIGLRQETTQRHTISWWGATKMGDVLRWWPIEMRNWWCDGTESFKVTQDGHLTWIDDGCRVETYRELSNGRKSGNPSAFYSDDEIKECRDDRCSIAYERKRVEAAIEELASAMTQKLTQR